MRIASLTKKNQRPQPAGKKSNAQAVSPEIIWRRIQACRKNMLCAQSPCRKIRRSRLAEGNNSNARAAQSKKKQRRTQPNRECGARLVPTKNFQRSCAPGGIFFRRAAGFVLRSPTRETEKSNAREVHRKEIQRSPLLLAGNFSNGPARLVIKAMAYIEINGQSSQCKPESRRSTRQRRASLLRRTHMQLGAALRCLLEGGCRLLFSIGRLLSMRRADMHPSNERGTPLHRVTAGFVTGAGLHWAV